MTATQNLTLKFKKHPHPRAKELGYGKNYRCFISECGKYLLMEFSQGYFAQNGQYAYEPNGMLQIWVRSEKAEAWYSFDGVPRKEITSLPYHYVLGVEGAISYIERWEKTQEYILSPDRETAILLRNRYFEEDCFANLLPEFFLKKCAQCGAPNNLHLVSFRHKESKRLDSKIMCKRCMT